MLDYIMQILFPYNGKIEEINLTTGWIVQGERRSDDRQMIQDLIVSDDGSVRFEEYDDTGFIYRKWQLAIPSYKVNRLFHAVSQFMGRKRLPQNGGYNAWELNVKLSDGKTRQAIGAILPSVKFRSSDLSGIFRKCIPIDGLMVMDGGMTDYESEEADEDDW